MKTTRVLTAVSAAALLGISSVALAQGTGGSAGGGAGASGAGASTGQSSGGGGAGSSGAPAGNTMQRQQDAPPSGSMSKDSMQKGDRAQGKDSMKSNQAQQDRMGKDSQKSQAQDRTPGASDTKSKMSKDQDAKSGSTVGAAGSGGVNLTTEQRTTLRQSVLTTSAPRVDSVNFAVNVGTVVPSSVRVVEVPSAIVKIRPAWKGYRYFVYHDDIIIVEPRTLKIVAVLEV